MKKITQNFYPAKTKRTSHVLFGLFFLLLMNVQASWGQATLPLYDGLNYTAGTQLYSGTNWGYNGSGTAGNDMPIVTGSLSYPGLAASTGNKTVFVGGGDDETKAFTTTGISNGNGTTVYYSYLMNITDLTSLGATGGYMVGLINSATLGVPGTAPGSGSIAAAVWVKPGSVANTFNIGFSGRATQATVGTTSSSLIYDGTNRPLGTPVLIVCSITFVTGNGNDTAKVWINPIPGAAEPTPSILAASSANFITSSDLADVAAIFIKQNGNTSTPTTELDEFRVGTTWTSVTPSAPIAPTLIADNTLNNVENDIDISFVDDGTWFGLPTDVKINGTSLASNDYVFSLGNLKLKPSNGNVLLTTSGLKYVTIAKSGYSDASLSQNILPGAIDPNKSTVVLASGPLAPNATKTVNCTAKDQYGNAISGYQFKYDATVTNATAATAESYTVDGTALTATANDLNLANTNTAGLASFTIALQSIIDGDDGISVQVQLNDGATNVGSVVAYKKPFVAQTITFATLAPVTYGNADFTLTATSTTSATNPITYSSSDLTVATVSGNTVTIVGAGSTNITASQAGNNIYSATTNMKQLNVNKATPTLSITNPSVTYDGSIQSADVSGSVLGTVSNIVNGTNTNAGTYAVTADFVPTDIANYNSLTAGSAGNFVINKATPTLSVTSLSATYNGLGQSASVSGSVSGIISNILNGGAVNQTNANTYAVTADFVPTDTANYNSLVADSAGNFVINKATPTISITNTPVTYNGSGQSASVSGSIPGTISNILNGGDATKTNAGTYAVTADFVPTDTANYNSLTADSAGTFVINKADQTITFGTLANLAVGHAPINLLASASSGLGITYTSSNSSFASVSGNTMNIVGPGNITITASQAGDANYNAAPDVTSSFVISNSLGTNGFNTESSVIVYSNGKQAFVANVKSNTTVTVYSLTGALITTVETSSDTTFDLESGIWIAKAKSAEGEKTVKLLIQ